MNKIKIILMGTSAFAVPSFESILESDKFEVLAVFTQPDKNFGRKQIKKASDVKELLINKHPDIPVFQPNNLKNSETKEQIEKLNPDIIFVISYGHLLPIDILEIPKLACINLHASLLPKLRGASPINNAILEGFEKTGISFFKLEKGMDDGDIIWKEEIPLLGNEYANELHDYLKEFGAKLSSNVLYQYANSKLQEKSQKNSEATYCNKLNREDGLIQWGLYDAEYIERQVRAFTPWPGTYTNFKNKRLKIFEVELSEERPHKLPGTVFLTASNKVAVRAKNKSLILKTVQLEGKGKCNIESILNGYNDFLETILS